MKRIIMLLGLLVLPLSMMFAVTEISISCVNPNDEHGISQPIGRTLTFAPIIGIIGIEDYTLLRLQNATSDVYQVQVIQRGNVKFSSVWNFQDEELSLPSDLHGEYEIILSDGSNSFVGTFFI